MIAVSNYQCALMDELYPGKKWKKTIMPEMTNHATKGKRTEVLWTNYEPKKVRKTDGGDNGWLFQDSA